MQVPNSVTARYLYIHGFNSAPASRKARDFVAWCRANVPGACVEVPELSHEPVIAMQQLETLMQVAPVNLILGSSLGGYYATWLSEKYNVPAALINPAVSPWQSAGTALLGTHTNYYTGRQYKLTAEHVSSLKDFEVPRPGTPGNILVLLQTGDEILDYRRAQEKYRDCCQIVQEGGNHAFTGFTTMLPAIVARASDGLHS